MLVNIWSSGYDGTRMKKKNVDRKKRMVKWIMDIAWYCMCFRRILGIYHPCQIKDW